MNNIKSAAKRNSARKGFTLIETLLYAALFATVMSFAILIFYQSLSSESQNRARREVETEADFLMRKIIWTLNSAQSISQPAVNATSSALALSKYGYAENPLVFDVSGGVARLSKAGGQAVRLTNNNVRIDQMTFSHLPASGSRPEAVQVVISMSASTSEPIAEASTTLENTIYLSH